MIVITTPTGRIGSQVLENVLDGGEPIRIIVREPSRLDPQIRKRVEIVEGSHADLDVVTEAFAGVESVFWLVPPNPCAENVLDYYLDFTRPASEAIKRQGVGRVVGVSSLGRDHLESGGSLSAAFAMEEMIEDTGVSYRSLGLPFFMENLLNQVETIKDRGMFSLANSADRPLATIATRDIAALAADLLLDDSWSGQDGIPVIGPDDLSPDDMAQVMSEALERPIRFQQIPDADFRATMTGQGVSEAWAKIMTEAVAAQNEGIYDDAAIRAQRSPTSFRQWCETVLKPSVLAPV